MATARWFASALISLLFATPAMAQYAPAPEHYAPPQGGYPPPAAQGAKLVGFELSAALALATPAGDRSDGQPLGNSIGVHFPVILGVGYRVSPLLSFSGIFQYAFGTTKNCPAGESCSSSGTRLGAEARLHFNAEQSFAPTLAFGLGYEWLAVTEEAGNTSATTTVKGLELGVEFGGDSRIGPQFVLTPFIGLHVGQFTSADIEQPGYSQSGDIPSSEQSMHGWIMLGCRGAFTL